MGVCVCGFEIFGCVYMWVFIVCGWCICGCLYVWVL